MAKPINPFVYGGPVDVKRFTGRTNEINHIFDQLNNLAHGSVAICGERRIGKTSLLHYISNTEVAGHRKTDHQQTIFIFQDCGSISPFTVSNFWRKILKRLQRQLKTKNNPDLLQAVEEHLSSDSITEELEFLLDDLHEAGLLVVLILDEFEWCVRTGPQENEQTRNFLMGLRSLINHRSRALSLIVATRQPVDEVCKDIQFMGSPFYNNFVFLYMSPFSREDAQQLLTKIPSDTGVTFSQNEIDFILNMVGTHPLLLQAAAAHVFDAKVKTGGDVHDFTAIRRKFSQSVKHQFQDLWDSSTSKMREILTDLACDNHSEAATRLDTFSMEFDKLLQRGLITLSCKKDNTNPKYEIFSPVFKEWLNKHFYRLGVNGRSNNNESLKASPRPSPTDTPTVFISYSHKDETEKKELLVQLKVLEKGAGLIDAWSDDRIGGGGDWQTEITGAMEQARVAILLISANFLTSEFILGQEVPPLLQRRKNEGLVVIPVIAKHCDWESIDWLAKLNVRPKNGTPIWNGNSSQPDKELTAIVKEVRETLRQQEHISVLTKIK